MPSFSPETSPSDAELHQTFRLLPSERIAGHGGSHPRVGPELKWIALPALMFAMAMVAALFGILIAIQEPSAGSGVANPTQSFLVAGYLVVAAVGLVFFPRWFYGTQQYVVTDRRILIRQGHSTRSIERHAITYARVHWNASWRGVGHLELVRATPFGPLMRRQRVILRNIQAPDAVYALIRGEESTDRLGDPDAPLTERLDADEHVVWGGGPEGRLFGWREAATSLLGLVLVANGLLYANKSLQWLLGYESIGLAVNSSTWVLFFIATFVAWLIMTAIGVGLVWVGLPRTRELGLHTEYLLTTKRLLIRRGDVELSVDRKRIVDVVSTNARADLADLYLILDNPDSRALADSGVLGPALLAPLRNAVPPVLFEVRDAGTVRNLLAGA